MKFFAQLRYMFRHQRLQMLITLLVFFGIYWFVNSPMGQKDFTWWTQNWDAVIGITTFLIAFFVWLGETNQDWENKLPKKLTVTFMYRENTDAEWKKMMCCRNAFLAGEGDIRQWAQQIGKQMNNDNYLNFLPFMRMEKAPMAQKKEGNWYKFYEVTIYLTKKPDLGTEEENQKFETAYLLWTAKLNQPSDFDRPQWEARDSN